MATLNMGNSNIIGISYSEMNKMKSNLKKSQQMLETSQRNVSTARVQLQVDRGRLRVTEDSLSSIYTEASKRKAKIDKMCRNIDYTIRRFKEVDSKCAQRIKAIGNSYSNKTSLFDKIKNAMISLGNYIFGRGTSLLKEGQDAFDNLGNKNSTEKSNYLEMIDSPYSMSDNPTLGQLIELNPNAPMYENAASEGQKYFLVWYYGSAAYERLDAATLSHNSYLVYKLTNLYKEGVDLSKLTITDIDRMCFDNASFWTKADQVAVGAYGAYTGYKHFKGSKDASSIDIEEVSGDIFKGAGNAERQLLSSSEWNEYFKQTYGSENVEWVTKNKASFGSRNLLEGHFDKHGSEFGGIYSNADEYLQGAKDVMNNGYKVEYDYKVTDKWGMKVPEQRTGYMRFMGNNRKGEAKFEFVGTNNRGDITTYHTESGKTLWKLLNGSNTDKTINPVK